MRNFKKLHNYKYIISFIKKIFLKADFSIYDSNIIASSLVKADLRGVWSHGIARTSIYYKRVQQGLAKKNPKIK